MDLTNPNPDKASLSEPLGGQPARRVGAAIAGPMVSRRNAADGRPAVRPKGAPQRARLRVALLDKGATIACGARLDSDPLWDSECGFVRVRVSNCSIDQRRSPVSMKGSGRQAT